MENVNEIIPVPDESRLVVSNLIIDGEVVNEIVFAKKTEHTANNIK